MARRIYSNHTALPVDLLVSTGFPARPDTREAALSGGLTSIDCTFDKSNWVEAMERCGNRRPRVQKLVSAWNQGIRGDADDAGEVDDERIAASVEPSKRPRTRLTDNEVDGMRTARDLGVSVKAIAKQFGIHRGTVWAKTR